MYTQSGNFCFCDYWFCTGTKTPATDATYDSYTDVTSDSDTDATSDSDIDTHFWFWYWCHFLFWYGSDLIPDVSSLLENICSCRCEGVVAS